MCACKKGWNPSAILAAWVKTDMRFHRHAMKRPVLETHLHSQDQKPSTEIAPDLLALRIIR